MAADLIPIMDRLFLPFLGQICMEKIKDLNFIVQSSFHEESFNGISYFDDFLSGFFFFLDFCEMGFADLLVLLLDLCRSRCWVL